MMRCVLLVAGLVVVAVQGQETPPCNCPLISCSEGTTAEVVPGSEANCCGGSYKCVPKYRAVPIPFVGKIDDCGTGCKVSLAVTATFFLITIALVVLGRLLAASRSRLRWVGVPTPDEYIRNFARSDTLAPLNERLWENVTKWTCLHHLPEATSYQSDWVRTKLTLKMGNLNLNGTGIADDDLTNGAVGAKPLTAYTLTGRYARSGAMTATKRVRGYADRIEYRGRLAFLPSSGRTDRQPECFPDYMALLATTQDLLQSLLDARTHSKKGQGANNLANLVLHYMLGPAIPVIFGTWHRRDRTSVDGEFRMWPAPPSAGASDPLAMLKEPAAKHDCNN